MQTHLAPLTLALCGAAGLAGAADKWLQVETANFTVVSNAGEGRLRRTSLEFEQVRAAYEKVWPQARLGSRRPVVVLALKNRKTMKRWAPKYFEVKGGIDVVSASVDGADRTYLLLRTDSRPADAEVTPNYNLYRAYLRLLLSRAFERRLPLWLSSGFSVVLDNTSVRDDEILLGQPVPWEIRTFIDSRRVPLRAILDARRDSPLLTQQGQREVFDAQCYMLVHYLLFGDHGAHSAKLSRFQQLWQAGRSHDEALAEAFGDLQAIEDALPIYATRPLLSYAQFPTDATLAKQRPEGRLLAPAEVFGLQAALHVAMGRTVEAQTSLREARTADPESPLSYDAEGLLADRDDDKPAATAAYARAVVLGSSSAHSHYRAAQLAWQADADAAALAQRRLMLERAIELNPSYTDAHSLLAETLVEEGDGEAALAAAERAVALGPGETYHGVALARALHALDRDQEARESARIGLRLAENERDESNARRFLTFLEQSASYEQQRRQLESARARNACSGGDATACAEVLPDLQDACEKQRDGNACRFLAWLYGGNGLPKDPAESTGYLALACAAGEQGGCVEHAWALSRGEGVTPDEAAAMETLAGLCSEGVLPGCVRLGLIHASKGTAADRERALTLLSRACEGGEQDACTFAQQLN